MLAAQSVIVWVIVGHMMFTLLLAYLMLKTLC